MVKTEPFLGYTKRISAGGFIFEMDSNIDVYDFSKRVYKEGKRIGVQSEMKCEFKNFIFKQGTKELIGILTSNGIIQCDNVFICGSYYSPKIVQKLGLRLPIIPLKGYTFT